MSEVLPIEEDPRFRLSTASADQTDFTVPFPFQANADVVVYKIAEEVTTLLEEAEDYTLVGAGETAGGTVTLNEGAEAGWQLLIVGQIVLDRLSSIVAGGKYNSRATDADLDRGIIGLQEARRDLARALKVAFGETGPTVTIGDDNTLAMWLNGELVPGPEWGDDVGIPGPGIIAGGDTGQVLRKASDADFDMEWATPRPALEADLELHVSPAGDDGDDGGSGAPFLTVNRADDVARSYDAAGFNVTIHVADGAYSESVAVTDALANAGGYYFVGNHAAPGNVTGLNFYTFGRASISLDGFEVESLSASEYSKIEVIGGSISFVGDFLDVAASDHAEIDIIAAFETIAGDKDSHLFVVDQAKINYSPSTTTLVGVPDFSGAYATASYGGEIAADYWQTIGDVTGTATGKRHLVEVNSVISSAGDDFPGDEAGIELTGGYFDGIIGGASGIVASVVAGSGINVDATDPANPEVSVETNLQTWNAIAPSANVQAVASAANYAAIRALLDLEAGTDFYSKTAADAAFQPLDADLTTWASITPSANVQAIVSAANYAAIRILLGLVIGTNVQAWDADLDTWATVTPSANGKSLVSAADYAAIRALLDLEAGTDFYSKTAADAAFQPLDADLTTWASITPSANVQAIVSAANYAAIRILLGLVIGTNVQAWDADLDTWATVTPSANGKSLVSAADYAAMRTLLSLVIGTNVQAWDADLDTWATVTPSANGKSLVSAADYAAMRTLLGLVIGTNVQAYDADLTTWAGLTPSANFQTMVPHTFAQMRADLDLEAGTDFYSITAADAAFQPKDSDLTSWAAITRAAGFDTFVATPSSANLAAAVTDETGSGALVFANTPTLVTPVIGAATGTSLSLSGSGLTPFVAASTDAGAGAGPIADLYRDSASPAASDVIGEIDFNGRDSAANKQLYANVSVRIDDATSTSEDASMAFAAVKAGTLTDLLYLARNAAGTATVDVLGLPKGQLSFPATQNASADANTFDDYEEGTSTPTYSATGLTASYAYQGGAYVKVGQFLYTSQQINLNTSGNTLGSAALSLASLPFTISGQQNTVWTVQWGASTTTMVNVFCKPNVSTTTASFSHLAAAATSSSTTNSNNLLHATNGTIVTVGGFYQTAA